MDSLNPDTAEFVRLEDLKAAPEFSGRKHILSLLVENRAGVLARVAGLFSRRGFNIDTLAVGPTQDPDVSRITLTLDGALHPIGQVTKQLEKLINVIEIEDLDPDKTVVSEMALLRVTVAVENRAEVMHFAKVYGAEAVDVSHRSITLRVVGTQQEIDDFEALVQPYGDVEMVRTGEIAILRSAVGGL